MQYEQRHMMNFTDQYKHYSEATQHAAATATDKYQLLQMNRYGSITLYTEMDKSVC